MELVDTLCINCRLRMIYWTERELEGENMFPCKTGEHEIDTETDRRGEIEEMLQHGRMLEEGCLDFVNTLEEVYDTLQLLCILHKRKKITSVQLCKKLINFLHLNILPLLKLNSSHLQLLQHSITQQEKYLNSLNELILMKTIQQHEIKNSKKRNRKNLRLLINKSSDTKFQEGFVELLEHEYNLELENNMNQYKEMVIELDGWSKETKESDKNLEMFKIKIKEMKEDIVSLNSVLERMGKSRLRKEGWLRSFISHLPLGDDAQLQKIYLQMDVKVKEIQKEIYTMMDKKLMVSSVMETMRGVSNDLRGGHESYGLEIEKKSRVQMSNILSNSFATRSFKSLPEQINVILVDHSHHLTTTHLRTEFEVKNLIHSTLIHCKQQKLYNSLVAKLNFKPQPSFNVFFRSNSEGHYSSDNSIIDFCKRCDLESSEDYSNEKINQKFKSLQDITKSSDSTTSKHLGLQNSTNVPTFRSYIDDQQNYFKPEYNFSYVTETIDQLKEDIPGHFNSICSDIQLKIDNSYNELNFRKVWVIYENYFFDQILDLLIELYMTEYESKVRLFVEKIGSLTIQDLDLETSNITRLLNHHTKKLDISKVTTTPFIESPSLNSEKFILTTFGKFFNSTEEINKTSNELSSSSDFSEYFDSDDGEVKMEQFQMSSNEEKHHQILKSKDLKSTLTLIKNTPLDSVSSSELLCLDAGEDLDFDLMSVKLQPCILDRFTKAYGMLRRVLVAKTLMKKTHYLSNCLKEVSLQLQRLSMELTGKSLSACNDDLMDTIILLLCNTTDQSTLAGLYVQVKLLTDYLASFFESGEFKFTLTLFLGVCNHLQDKIFMKNYKQSTFYKASSSL